MTATAAARAKQYRVVNDMLRSSHCESGLDSWIRAAGRSGSPAAPASLGVPVMNQGDHGYGTIEAGFRKVGDVAALHA